MPFLPPPTLPRQRSQDAQPAQPARKKIGGVRAVTIMGGNSGSLAKGGGVWGRVPQAAGGQDAGRQARIDAARADGTFATKRDTFNKGNRSSYMDETGQIGARADTNLKGLADNKKIGTKTFEGGMMNGPSPVKMPTVDSSKVDPGMTNSKGGYGGSVPMPTVNISGNGGAVKMPQAGPATPTIGAKRVPRDLYAEEKNRAGDALLAKANKDQQATLNKINNPAPGSVEAKALALQNAAKTNIEAKKLISSIQPKSKNVQTGIASIDSLNLGAKMAQKPSPVVTPPGTPAAASSVVATAKPETIKAPSTQFGGSPSKPTVGSAAPAAQKTAATPPATPAAKRVTPTQAQKNPAGMSARMGAGTPSPTPAILQNPIGTIGNAIASAGSAAASSIRSQGDKNPTGIAAKISKLFGRAKDDVKVAARAEGGPIKKDKPYLVGEEGPEIVVPKQDGTVIPNLKTKKKIGSLNFKMPVVSGIAGARG